MPGATVQPPFDIFIFYKSYFLLLKDPFASIIVIRIFLSETPGIPRHIRFFPGAGLQLKPSSSSDQEKDCRIQLNAGSMKISDTLLYVFIEGLAATWK